jgi:uncharacterized protein (TIGR03083 family)
VTVHQPVVDVSAIAPVRHSEAMRLARNEYERLATLLSNLDDDQWAAPTGCAPWTVRDMATHLLGYMRAASSPREMARQLRLAHKRGGSFIDAVSALQVSELSDLGPAEIAGELRALIGSAVRGRTRVPGWLRQVARVPAELPVCGARERWPLGFVVDIIGTRDGWMHRMDICLAVGQEPELTPEHDGRLVADVVAEWAKRSGRPFDLRLDGPAGGMYASGRADHMGRYDAVEFCRLLSGRGGTPPLGVEVPF